MSPQFGEPRHHHRLTDSTNERARELAVEGAPTGTVVTAEEQSAGRGRQGRVWSAPPGRALLYSAILRDLDLGHALLPIAVPLAVCEACEAVAEIDCRIKWPNDVWLDERKLAGVLIEARPPDWAVIGVGINVSIPEQDFPADLRRPATSIGAGADPEHLLDELNAALGRWVEAPAERVLVGFAERDALRGRPIAWEGGPDELGRQGIAAGIDERGNLIVSGADGAEARLGSGEVSLRLA